MATSSRRYLLPLRCAPLVAALALLGLLQGCAKRDTAEPRVLEYQTSQEVQYVSVSTYALQAESATWWEQQCEQRLQPSRIVVKTEPSQILYDYSQGLQQLDGKSGLARGAKQHTLGLTVAEMRTSLKWEGNYLVDSKTGRACMRPQLTVNLSVNPQTVFIAREFPRGTCGFNHIAQHELRHVRANQTQLEATADQLRKELEQAFGNRVFYGEHAKMKAQLEHALTTDWLPWAKAQLRKVEAQHQAIDSPQEYAANRSVCSGEIARVLDQAVR